jgi:asparagine synthase (glutamine-hydrolysing)
VCGIIGGFGQDVDDEWVSKETLGLAHRGPDYQQSLRISELLSMGSARLAMTDPHPRSHQPFRELSDALVFNGEIFNFLELKSTLQNEGVKFHTESDTEVLFKSLKKWGLDISSRLSGMFAFAFFDSERNEVILGRDALGKKPLYYLLNKSTVHWSSSLQSLKRLQQLPDLNNESLFEYLSLGYSIDEGTIIQGIRALKPGRLLRVAYKDSGIKLTEVDAPKIKINGSEQNDLKLELSRAVNVRVHGHQTAAISLSGGIDSSLVAMLASNSDVEISAYSSSWPDSDKARYNDDSSQARIIAKNIGIKYTEVQTFRASELENNLNKFLTAMEEPNSNPTGLSMMNLYERIANDGHRLVLTGDGADEILGGYPRYNSMNRFPKILNIESGKFHQLLSSPRTPRNQILINFLISQKEIKSLDRWLHFHWNFAPSELLKLLPMRITTEVLDSFYSSLKNYSNQSSNSAVEFAMSLDRDVWLSMESNRKLDRVSMYHSIEARSPFQDERVISAALADMKKNQFKRLNKARLFELFPELEAIGVKMEKSGYISPVGHWLRENPKLVRRTLGNLSDALGFDAAQLHKLESAPQQGDFRNIMKLWSLVVLGYWVEMN